ncbi:serine hydrolase domain-containing protein [Parvularcula maris]|uniref:Beta-lactamase family protein n=1 Tax=Parvularcula maris TaxID=2965077 RepID=A0A9X2L8C7_9PROT|nr:serine hydrolase domain-containing protein [Parvularcula maris]MCQ8184970.1 beta-lactamase family protein [Parvularcula maris]
MADLRGEAEDRFARVEETLAASIDRGEDLGASVAVIIEGETVIDIAGGYQDKAKTLPYEPRTLTCVFSSGKAVCAALIAAAVSEGKLAYDEPVATYWPDFAAKGKEKITVAQALSHQAGLAAFTEEKDPAIWVDWEATCAALAEMAPLWEPGTASGYGPQTYGFIAGELLRRVNGQTVGQQLKGLTRDVICGMGLSEATRAAPLVKPKRAPDLGEIDEITKAAFLLPWSAPSGISRQTWAAAEIPASNMHACAHGLAEIMQLFAAGRMGDKLAVSDSVREEAWQERISGPDKVLPFHLSWAAGVMRETYDGRIFGAPPTAIGHYGFGGSCVLADPARGLSFAYVPNQQSHHLVADPRATALLRAVYQALS